MSREREFSLVFASEGVRLVSLVLVYSCLVGWLAG
jgi:hypothetical protein